MTAVETAPGPTVRQVSGSLPAGGPSLSVLAKRTYRIVHGGRCVVHETQPSLQEEPAHDDADGELLAADTDLVAWKPLTDVVVRGHVRSRQPTAEMAAGVRLGAFGKVVAAVGRRRATVTATGRVAFSPAEPFTELPLSFALAYGGRDAVAERKLGNPAERFARFLPPSARPEMMSPYLYPRNPCGRGYLIEASRAAVDALALPQLEEPDDRITPERLAAGDPRRWLAMPVPQSLGWLGHAWFPRAVYFGVVPDHEPPERPPLEVRKGWAPPDVLVTRPFMQRFDMRAANGASLGLQLPHLRGDEAGSLHGFDARGEVLRFALPGERPRIWIDGRKGKLAETEPVIHTVVIDADERTVSVVWRGMAPALRPYSHEELARMPLQVRW